MWRHLGRGPSVNANRNVSCFLTLFWKRTEVSNFKFYNILEGHIFLCRHPAVVHWEFKIEFSWGSLVLLTKGIVQKVSMTCYFLHGSAIGSAVCVMAWTPHRILWKVCNPGDCISECSFCSLTFTKKKDTANLVWKLEIHGCDHSSNDTFEAWGCFQEKFYIWIESTFKRKTHLRIVY